MGSQSRTRLSDWTELNSAYRENKQGGNIQPYHTPFPILNQSVILCLVLIVASWLAYRFLRRQIKWCGTPRIPEGEEGSQKYSPKIFIWGVVWKYSYLWETWGVRNKYLLWTEILDFPKWHYIWKPYNLISKLGHVWWLIGTPINNYSRNMSINWASPAAQR